MAIVLPPSLLLLLLFALVVLLPQDRAEALVAPPEAIVVVPLVDEPLQAPDVARVAAGTTIRMMLLATSAGVVSQFFLAPVDVPKGGLLHGPDVGARVPQRMLVPGRVGREGRDESHLHDVERVVRVGGL